MFNVADFLFFWCLTLWWYWRLVHCLPGLPLGWDGPPTQAGNLHQPVRAGEVQTKRRWQKMGSWNNLGLLRTFGVPPQPQSGLPWLWPCVGHGWGDKKVPELVWHLPHTPPISPTLVLYLDYQTQLLRNSLLNEEIQRFSVLERRQPCGKAVAGLQPVVLPCVGVWVPCCWGLLVTGR